MKKIIYATIALVATICMVSCSKDDDDKQPDSPIVGTWESTQYEFSAVDENGKTLTLEEAIYQDMKRDFEEDGYEITDERIRATAAEYAADIVDSTDPIKLVFNADGTLKSSVKTTGGKWVDEAPGTYKLEGNNLTITNKEDGETNTIKANVLSLTDTELKFRINSNELESMGVSSITDVVYISYDLTLTITFKKEK